MLALSWQILCILALEREVKGNIKWLCTSILRTTIFLFCIVRYLDFLLSSYISEYFNCNSSTFLNQNKFQNSFLSAFVFFFILFPLLFISNLPCVIHLFFTWDLPSCCFSSFLLFLLSHQTNIQSFKVLKTSIASIDYLMLKKDA